MCTTGIPCTQKRWFQRMMKFTIIIDMTTVYYHHHLGSLSIPDHRGDDLTWHTHKKEKQNRNQAPKSNGIQTAFVGSNFGIAVGRDCSLSDLWIGLHCLASFHLVQLDNVIIFEACATLLHFLWSYLFHIDRPNQLFESLLLYEFWFSYICQNREGQRKTVFLVHII